MPSLRSLLIEPTLRDVAPDSPDFTLAHRRVLLRKRMVRSLFEDFYRRCRTADARYFGSEDGLRVEIGSGSSFMKSIYPEILATDIKLLPFVDLVADARHLPFAERTLRALYGINVFHHIPQPRLFFGELTRVLRPGGGAVLIEPHYGPLARFLFRRLHKSEGFDERSPSWENERSNGPMSGANQALSFLVFVRDRERFTAEFPDLEIVVDEPHTCLTYLLSGGLNFRQLVPDVLLPAVATLDRSFGPLTHAVALQHTIVLRRR